MSFDSVVGQERPKKILKGALEGRTLSSSYLFFGPSGVGKLALALELAKAVNCQRDGVLPCDNCSACRRIAKLNYSDVSVTFPVPSTIKDEELKDAFKKLAADLYHLPRFQKSASIPIDTVRTIRSEASYKPFEGQKKVFILADAHKLNIHAANALLKTLEEPPPNVLIILTTTQPGKLLPTVLSRCQKIRFGLLSEIELARALETTSAGDASQIRLVSRLAQGNLDRARELLRDDVAGRRSSTLSMLTTALSGNLLSVLKSAEMLGKSKHRSISEENLETLQIWYRDLLLLLEDKEEYLINQDLKPQLSQMAAQYDWPGVLRSLHLIEDTRRALEFNVNLELAWMVLLFKLKRLRRVRT